MNQKEVKEQNMKCRYCGKWEFTINTVEMCKDCIRSFRGIAKGMIRK